MPQPLPGGKVVLARRSRYATAFVARSGISRGSELRCAAQSNAVTINSPSFTVGCVFVLMGGSRIADQTAG